MLVIVMIEYTEVLPALVQRLTEWHIVILILVTFLLKVSMVQYAERCSQLKKDVSWLVAMLVTFS